MNIDFCKPTILKFSDNIRYCDSSENEVLIITSQTL